MPVKILSRFTPMTYDEIAKPLIQQTEAQQALENDYLDMSQQAAELEAQANQQTDRESYAKLKAMSDDIKYQADQLLSRGLQSGSRRAILNLKQRYNQEIVPINQAITRRNELAKEQQQMRAKNPNLLFQRDMGNVSLDELVNNPQANYGQIIDQDDVMKKAATITSAFKTASLSLGRNLDRYTQQIIQQSGLTPEEIQAALNGDGTMLDKALKNLYTSTGVHTWGDRDAEDRVNSAIWQGAMMGQGSVDIKTQADKQAAINESRRSERIQMEASGYTYNPVTDSYEPDYDKMASIARAKKVVEEGASAVNPSTGLPYKDGDLTHKVDETGDYYTDASGNRYKRVAKNVYVTEEYDKQNVNVSSAVKAKREEFEATHPGGIVMRDSWGDNSRADISEERVTREVNKALASSDTEYITDYTAIKQKVRDKLKEDIKGSGRENLVDYYIILSKQGYNHYILIPKDKASDEVKAKFNTTSTTPRKDTKVEAQSQPKSTIQSQETDTTGITAANAIGGFAD